MTLIASQASALDVTVNPGGNIQAALDQVGNAGGGTVLVKSGTYTISTSLLIPNETTLKGSGTTKPIIKLTSGVNKQVIRNKSIPFTNCKVDFIHVNGGLTTSEMNNGSRLNVIGIDLSDQHNEVRNYYSHIVNCYISNCAMDITLGRTTDVKLINTTVTNCGSYYSPPLHNVYISTCDKIFVDRLVSTYCKVGGMGLKITDFYENQTETSCVVQGCQLNYNTDRGMAVYDMNPLTVTGNTCNNNTKSGINIFRCTSGGVLTNNTAMNNGNQPDVAYDIWLNACTNMQISGNTYGTKRGF